ncbi:hypothetical protein [Pontibacter akesuensis]|uniref:Uncharacterized protein n=1 Tax=Pontibacter akesuensis TaxID=388950 RepID=A0A1I7KTL3_9BACT|nr:hypothetical protein [Pontibacter akesuensis]GHA80667.1 hypothetical protein GCM10007389_38790 [Pontibacter akesuensis]SFV00803.1 hypothetical protein SAMN04487941_4100 [Pontibacter akesuensis]
MQHTRDKDAILQLLNKVLPKLAERIHANLEPVLPLFDDYKLEKVTDTWTKDPHADDDTEISVENGNVQQVGLKLRLEGFQRAGADAFDIAKNLIFKLELYDYSVGTGKGNAWLEKQYYESWTDSEMDEVAVKWSEELIEEITQRVAGIGE